jgi:GYF domain 2
MYTILGSDGKTYGPVSQQELMQWIREGRVDRNTSIQAKGSDEWKPVSSFPEFSSLFPNVSQPPPMPLQARPFDADAFAAKVLSRSVDISIGDCVSRSWEAVKPNLWLCVGAVAIVLVASGVGGGILRMFPYIGQLLSAVLSGILTAGLWFFFLKLIRNQNPTIEDTFEGFKTVPVPLGLLALVTSLITLVVFAGVALPFLFPYAAGLIQLVQEAQKGAPNLQNLDFKRMFPAIGALFFLGILLAVIAVTILSVLWLFAKPLVIDRKMDFWPAIVLSVKVTFKSFFSIFCLVIVTGCITALGVLGCCVGILFTMPISMGALAYAYEDIFGSA